MNLSPDKMMKTRICRGHQRKPKIMTFTPISPSGIALLATLRCTSACDNCCFGCNPREGRSMTYEEMKRYVDMSLEAYPDTITSLGLTGGECMILGKSIERIVAYATGRGLTCNVVTNAFWATDYDTAFATLKRLKDCGLENVGFSTGMDHSRYVPWQNVRNAAVAAVRLDMTTELRIEGALGSDDITDAFDNDYQLVAMMYQGKLHVVRSGWMEFHNKGKKTRNWRTSFYDTRQYAPCESIFHDIVINPYGEVYACCGVGVSRIPQMRLGNVNQEPVKVIYERAFDDFLKVWLHTEGPEKILKFVHDKTGQKFPWHSCHICDLCRVIFTDKTIVPIIRENIFQAVQLFYMSYENKAKRDRAKKETIYK